VYGARMRDATLKLLIAAMLFVSMEGVAESVDDASFHQTHHTHVDDVGNQWFPDSDGSDHESDACEHFCHAHVVALIMQATLPDMQKFQLFVPASAPQSVTRATAPPTPPPNI
jgi:hypothetical protein